MVKIYLHNTAPIKAYKHLLPSDGKWGDIELTTDKIQANYHIIVATETIWNLPHSAKTIIFCLHKLHPNSFLHQVFEPPVRWTIKRTYDQLQAELKTKPLIKSNTLALILDDPMEDKDHKLVNELKEALGTEVVLYPTSQHHTALLESQYALLIGNPKLNQNLLIDSICNECLILHTDKVIEGKSECCLAIDSVTPSDLITTIKTFIANDEYSKRLSALRVAKKDIINKRQFFGQIEQALIEMKAHRDYFQSLSNHWDFKVNQTLCSSWIQQIAQHWSRVPKETAMIHFTNTEHKDFIPLLHDPIKQAYLADLGARRKDSNDAKIERHYVFPTAILATDKTTNLCTLPVLPTKESKVAILISSTSRNCQYQQAADYFYLKFTDNSLKATTGTVYTVFIGYDAGDAFFESEAETITKLSVSPIKIIRVLNPRQSNPCFVWNKLFEMAYNEGYDYFLQCGDDVKFETPNWDTTLMKTLQDQKDLGLTGARSPYGETITLAFVSRRHYEIFNYFYPPEFTNFDSDVWLTEIYRKVGYLKLYPLSEITMTNMVVQYDDQAGRYIVQKLAEIFDSIMATTLWTWNKYK